MPKIVWREFNDAEARMIPFGTCLCVCSRCRPDDGSTAIHCKRLFSYGCHVQPVEGVDV